MYKKYLIVASKLDKAGINITTQLSQFGDFNFYLVDDEIIYTENLDLDKIDEYDFIIFASKHRSGKGEKALTIHPVGNWKEARYGGRVGKVSKTSALFQKQLFEKLKANSEKYNLKEYDITMEATHHGPLIDKPSIFIEIGSTENEWKDRKAGFIIAKTIVDIMEDFKENPYNEVAFAIGGPHYCPNFNKIQLKSNVAISFVIPSYSLPITKEMIMEAMEKTEEEVDFALLDWKSLGNAEQRNEVIKVLEDNYIQWKKTSEIGKD